jgi:SAM-dependent methyltransferase
MNSPQGSSGPSSSAESPPALCPACGAASAPRLLYIKAGCEIVRCPQCMLVRVAARPGLADTVADIYSRDYFEGGQSDGYADYGRSEETLRLQAQQALNELRRFAPRGDLLEIGCAYGYFLLEASRHFRARGIEISPFAANEARRRGLNVSTGDILSTPLEKCSLDAVCLFDCIEHIADPGVALARIRGAMREKAVLALTTGDIGSLFARVCGKSWRLMTPPQHLFFYSRSTIRLLLQKEGFEVLAISYPWKKVPLSLMLYQISPALHRILSPAAGIAIGIPINLFDAMLVLARKAGPAP